MEEIVLDHGPYHGVILPRPDSLHLIIEGHCYGPLRMKDENGRVVWTYHGTIDNLV